MKKLLLFLTVLLLPSLLYTSTSWAHGGVTPSQVITDMKHKQKGPYAAPILRGKNLSQDWLGITTENYQIDDVSGVFIQKIKENGIGDSEGLEKGDIIIGANMNDKKTTISSLSDLDDVLAAIKEPVEVEFIVIRDGSKTGEDVYLVPSLDEIAPEMAGIMGGTNRPKPGMMIDKMMAQTPIGNMNKGGKKIRPGMFMEEMMDRSPLGSRHNIPTTGKVSGNDPLGVFLTNKLQEISFYKQHQKELGVSDKQLESLHKLQLDYKKQHIKNDADLKIKQLELDESLQGKPDLDKLKDNLEDLNRVHQKKHGQALKFLEEYYSITGKEQRLKLKEFMGN